MADPRFYLKDSNSSKPTLIYLKWFIDRRRFVYSTGEMIQPALWSQKREKISPRHPNAESVNTKLERLRIDVIDHYNEILKEKQFVRFAELRQALDGVTGKNNEQASLSEFIDTLIKQKKVEGKNKTTISNYKIVKTRLSEFANKQGRKEIDFADMRYETWRDFENFLAPMYAPNSVRKIMSKLKTVLKEAVKLGVNKKVDFQYFDISTKEQESTAIYLNKTELTKLFNIDYSDRLRLEKARDLFLIGATTGLRHSDFSRVSKKNVRSIKGIDFIEFYSQKGKDSVIIPLVPILSDLLDKYGDSPPEMKQQKLNDALKEIGRGCGFMSDKIARTINDSGKTYSVMTPRYELFSTHTARRSFATNAYLDGLDSVAIMMITGHKSEKEFLKYIRVSKEENALRIAKANQDKADKERAVVVDSLRWVLDHLDLSEVERDSFTSVLTQLSV